MVRECQESDLVDIYKLLKEFHNETLKDFGVKYDDGMVRQAFYELYSNALVLVKNNEVVGVIAGKIIDYPLQKAQIFQEMIWYVRKDYRKYGIKLLRAMEARCLKQGLSAMVMVHLSNSMSDKLDKFYTRCGYMKMETHYIRSLK